MNAPADCDVDVLVVGAGQAGLGAAYWLTRDANLSVRVIDRAPLGESWRERWDSLQLFTPRRFSSLPGLDFPEGPTRCPSRLEMADYLVAYTAHHALPVATGVTVTRLARDEGGFLAETSEGKIRARHVVLATGPFHLPFIPDAGEGLSEKVWQLHSYDYRRPEQVPAGRVLVVGGGNSAAQLAVELAQTHKVTVASPAPPWYLPEDVLGISMYWWTYLTGILNAGKDARVSRYIRDRGDAIVGKQLDTLVSAGRVRLHPHRVVSGEGERVRLEDGTDIDVAAVLWCTGFRADTRWLDVPGAVDSKGEPLHDEGASPVPGLHWMGLPWQTRLNSSIIDGVDRDARALAARIASDT